MRDITTKEAISIGKVRTIYYNESIRCGSFGGICTSDDIMVVLNRMDELTKEIKDYTDNNLAEKYRLREN